MNNSRFQQIKPNKYISPWAHLAKTIITTVLFSLLLPVTSNAQLKPSLHTDASFAEKIYLQIDKNIYTIGNIIWFKSIVTSAYNHVPSSLSSVLYVDLITPDESIYKTKLIKLENGIGDGFFT